MSSTTSQRDERIDLWIEHETLILTPREWGAFLAALDYTDGPRPRLQAAARRYQVRRERAAD